MPAYLAILTAEINHTCLYGRQLAGSNRPFMIRHCCGFAIECIARQMLADEEKPYPIRLQFASSEVAMPEPDLDSLVYVSSAVKLLSPEEIEYLLTKARERNKEYGITGILLYIGGNFMQYIEGPADNLEVIFKIIREDKQHSGIILVTREAINEREFGDWSMAYDTRDMQHYVGAPGDKVLLERNLERSATNPSAARILLHGFWNRSGT